MAAASSPGPARNGSPGPASAADPAPEPALVIVRGNPSAEEIAVVVTVLAARAARPAGATQARDATRSEWSARSRLLRTPLPRSPGGWRASALPR